MPTPNSFSIYFLDVGQGDCSLIWPPSADPVLVDCRSAYVANQFLLAHNITRLSAIIVSHVDVDHIAGMGEVVTELLDNDLGKIGAVYFDKERPKELGKEAKRLTANIVKGARADKFYLRSPTTEDNVPRVVASGPDWRIEIISPSHLTRVESAILDKHEPNALSAIVRVHCYGQTILLGADAPLAAWSRIQPQNLKKAEVIRAPHHGGDIREGSKRSSIGDFYREVGASLAVFSVGTNNKHVNVIHPLPEHVAAAGVGDCRRLCTQLTPQCHPKPEDVLDKATTNVRNARITRPYRQEEKDGDKPEVPCAGTVMIRISPDGTLETFPPSGGWHDQFITDHIPNALCRL